MSGEADLHETNLNAELAASYRETARQLEAAADFNPASFEATAWRLEAQYCRMAADALDERGAAS